MVSAKLHFAPQLEKLRASLVSNHGQLFRLSLIWISRSSVQFMWPGTGRVMLWTCVCSFVYQGLRMRRCRGCGCIPTLGAGDAEYRFASPLFRCNPPPHKNFGWPPQSVVWNIFWKNYRLWRYCQLILWYGIQIFSLKITLTVRQCGFNCGMIK